MQLKINNWPCQQPGWSSGDFVNDNVLSEKTNISEHLRGTYTECSNLEAPTIASQKKAPELRPPCVYPVSTPATIRQGACRRGRRGDPSLDHMRRFLFHSMDNGSADVLPAPGAGAHREDDEESWRIQIWESYGT